MLSDGEMNDLRLYLAVFEDQFPDRDRQVEASWAGAAGIEIEDSVASFDFGDMAVTVNYCGEPCDFRFQIEVVDCVKEVDGHAICFINLGSWQLLCPSAFVDVAADGGDWGDGCESRQDFRIADVSGVEDVVGAVEQVHRWQAKQAVCVGDDAEDHVAFSHLA